LTFDYNEDEMMHASVADVKWNAPLMSYHRPERCHDSAMTVVDEPDTDIFSLITTMKDVNNANII